MQPVTIRFDYLGDDTKSLDVLALADVLIAVSNVISTTNKVRNNDGSAVHVQIRPFEPGSFGIVVDVSRTFLQAASDIFTGNGRDALLSIIAIFGQDGIPGLLHLYRFVSNGYSIVETKRIDPRRERLTLTRDGQVLDVDVTAGSSVLVETPEIRVALNHIARPLRDDSAVGLRVTTPMARYELNSDDVGDEPGPAAVVAGGRAEVRPSRLWLQVASVDFRTQGKAKKSSKSLWKFLTMGRTISAEIADPVLLDRIERGERFGALDELDADVDVTMSFDDTGRAEPVAYRITHVREVKRPPVQMAIVE